MTDTRVLVTGAAGVIGRRLVPELLGRGYHVVAAHRQSAPPAELDGAVGISGDLMDPATLERAFDALGGARAQRILVHLAGEPTVSAAEGEPTGGRRANLQLTEQVLASAQTHGVGRCMIASTGLVYGGSTGEPLTETAIPVPRSAYASSKLAAELALSEFAERGGVPCDALRLGNVYGPESPDHTVVGWILKQVRSGARQVVVRSRGPVRDFIFVDDVVEAIWRLIEAPAGGGFAIVNVSTARGAQVGELVDIALRVAGLPVPDTVTPISDDVLVLDNATLRQRTGWAPERTLENGIRESLRAWQQAGAS